MDENKFLNENKYQKAEKKIVFIAILLLILGLGVGGYLIYRGVAKPSISKVSELKEVLENKKSELEAKGVEFNAFTDYTSKEAYDLKIITKALDPSFPNCNFDEYKNNSLTKEYCAAVNSTSSYSSHASIMVGVFICIATCMISGFVFMVAKRRSILAFQAQQVMPIAQEGIEKMAPTIGKAGASIAKEMAPVYGEIAKEIGKGIKEGMKDEEK